MKFNLLKVIAKVQVTDILWLDSSRYFWAHQFGSNFCNHFLIVFMFKIFKRHHVFISHDHTEIKNLNVDTMWRWKINWNNVVCFYKIHNCKQSYLVSVLKTRLFCILLTSTSLIMRYITQLIIYMSWVFRFAAFGTGTDGRRGKKADAYKCTYGAKSTDGYFQVLPII